MKTKLPRILIHKFCHTVFWCFLLFGFFTTAAQEDSEYVKPIPTRGFEFSLQVTPGTGYRHLLKPESATNVINSYDPRVRSESPHGAVNVGLLVAYRISKLFAVEMGTFYNYLSYCRNYKKYNSLSTPNVIYHRLLRQYESLDIPFRFRFTAGSGKFRFTGTLGVTTNVYLRATESSYARWHESEETRFIQHTSVDVQKQTNVSPSISAGIESDITNTLGFRVEPSFTFNALPTNEDSQNLQEHYWSVGIGFILFYRIK